jgi:hypothetical protein
MSYKENLRHKALEYAQREGLLLGAELGTGVHGSVFLTESQAENRSLRATSAIKAHHGIPGYRQERDVYLRLKERGVTSIGGYAVPQLLRYDDELWVIEMTVVTRPFLLDFAGAYLDKAPDFTDEVLDEVLADWQTDKREQFGARWPDVQSILAVLERHGVFMIDVHPNNISREP